MPRPRSVESAEYVSANLARRLTGIATTTLLAMVATGLVRTRVLPGMYPLYCVADIKQHRAGRNQKHPLMVHKRRKRVEA